MNKIKVFLDISETTNHKMKNLVDLTTSKQNFLLKINFTDVQRTVKRYIYIYFIEKIKIANKYGQFTFFRDIQLH